MKNSRHEIIKRAGLFFAGLVLALFLAESFLRITDWRGNDHLKQPNLQRTLLLADGVIPGISGVKKIPSTRAVFAGMSFRKPSVITFWRSEAVPRNVYSLMIARHGLT